MERCAVNATLIPKYVVSSNDAVFRRRQIRIRKHHIRHDITHGINSSLGVRAMNCILPSDRVEVNNVSEGITSQVLNTETHAGDVVAVPCMSKSPWYVPGAGEYVEEQYDGEYQ